MNEYKEISSEDTWVPPSTGENCCMSNEVNIIQYRPSLTGRIVAGTAPYCSLLGEVFWGESAGNACWDGKPSYPVTLSIALYLLNSPSHACTASHTVPKASPPSPTRNRSSEKPARHPFHKQIPTKPGKSSLHSLGMLRNESVPLTRGRFVFCGPVLPLHTNRRSMFPLFLEHRRQDGRNSTLTRTSQGPPHDSVTKSVVDPHCINAS